MSGQVDAPTTSSWRDLGEVLLIASGFLLPLFGSVLIVYGLQGGRELTRGERLGCVLFAVWCGVVVTLLVELMSAARGRA